jgi:DNA mismatch endonuclease (patch repair protein)
MVDIVTKKKRSKMMAGTATKGTWAECYVHAILDKLDINYKANVEKIPGKPDLYLPDYNSVILVHGCYWHGHGCHMSNWPDDNAEFWKRKILGTVKRDRKNLKRYQDDRYWVMTIWECALRGKLSRDREKLAVTIEDWLERGKNNRVISGHCQPRASIGKAC